MEIAWRHRSGGKKNFFFLKQEERNKDKYGTAA
jgi:hypothetical protein